ncbi:uncharacterized protein LOC126833015 isoform X2 [Adelges cooleyi]|uniref:uncharacterized protein LOC126833015 isoform X2 n=1 Tax=Adelges cooleyi TaxID=133065 RepID=UPI00217FFB19|nr:uncharacterized protein LOC126833015 isoform X2 [Adelges cooleyi]
MLFNLRVLGVVLMHCILSLEIAADNLGWESPFTERRQDRIPALYVKGSHFNIGYNTGKVFASMIQEFVATYTPLQGYLDAYNTPEGKLIYDDALTITLEVYPQYVRELEGIAMGANVSFNTLFLMQLDDTLTQNMPKFDYDKGPIGCTSILVNQPEFQCLVHTEDALTETVGHFYLLSAHVIPAEDEKGGLFEAREEIYEAITYASQLPGYASAHTFCGVVFSVNTIFNSKNLVNRIPRGFISRALLSTRGDFDDIIRILECRGGGAADGFNVNLAFINPWVTGGERVFFHIEVTPNPYEHKSNLNVHPFFPGENGLHINKLLYSDYPELHESGVKSSIVKTRRYRKLTKNNPIKNLADAIRVIGDRDDREGYAIFRDSPNDFVNTIMLVKNMPLCTYIRLHHAIMDHMDKRSAD